MLNIYLMGTSQENILKLNMDKDHLVDLITTSFFQDKVKEKKTYYIEMKKYLEKLDLEQLRTMSKEFIL